jgi:hypothetical protein
LPPGGTAQSLAKNKAAPAAALQTAPRGRGKGTAKMAALRLADMNLGVYGRAAVRPYGM